MRSSRRKIAALAWPRFSKTVEKVNWNARYEMWLKRHRAPHYASRYALHLAVFSEHIHNEIDLLEFGVWEGKSLQDFSHLTQAPGSKLYGFDSFQGLPHGGGNWKKGQFGESEIPKFEDVRVLLVKGWFHETLPQFAARELAFSDVDRLTVVHIDCDLHSSTLFVLATLNEYLKPGSIIFFDELSVAEEEFRALIDWSDAFMRNYRVLGTFERKGRVEGAALMIERSDADPTRYCRSHKAGDAWLKEQERRNTTVCPRCSVRCDVGELECRGCGQEIRWQPGYEPTFPEEPDQ